MMRPPTKDFALSVLRVAHIRARLAQTEIDMAGAALRGDLLTPDAALGMLSEVGLDYLPSAPEPTGGAP